MIEGNLVVNNISRGISATTNGEEIVLAGSSVSKTGRVVDVLVHQIGDVIHASKRIIDGDGKLSVSVHGYKEADELPQSEIIKRAIDLHIAAEGIPPTEKVQLADLDLQQPGEAMLRSLLVHGE